MTVQELMSTLQAWRDSGVITGEAEIIIDSDTYYKLSMLSFQVSIEDVEENIYRDVVVLG